jgi:hypothetical protein
MEQKLETILENIKEIGDDVKYLRGKTVQELFEIRKKIVKRDQKHLELTSVYV